MRSSVSTAVRRFREPFPQAKATPGVSTDSEIIQRSLEEPEAFSGIFERHVRPVGGYIRRRVGADAVDDALSETFLVAFRRRGSFDRSFGSALPWLLGIATRIVKHHRADEARQWRSFTAASGAASVDDGGDLGSDERMDADAAVRPILRSTARHPLGTPTVTPSRMSSTCPRIARRTGSSMPQRRSGSPRSGGGMLTDCGVR